MTGGQPGGDQLSFAIPTEAQQILAAARQQGALRARRSVAVDYDALNLMVRRQRAALTRAVRSGDIDNVVLACRDAVAEWDQPGAMWPDDWSRWQRALDDALPWNARVELGDLR
jgi:hypothetical protein